jgi:hypothetical protein
MLARYAGYVASRMSEACHDAGANRIVDYRENDGGVTSVANSENRSVRPSAQRYSMRHVLSGTRPSSRNLPSKAAIRLTAASARVGPKKETDGGYLAFASRRADEGPH